MLTAFIGGIFFALATWGLGLRSIKTAFPKLIPGLKTFGKNILKLIFGVGGLTFLKKNWVKIMARLKPALKLLGARLFKFGGRFIPIIRVVLLLSFALDLLKLGADALKKKYGDDFFDPFIMAINKVIDIFNSLPIGLRFLMLGVPGIKGFDKIPLGIPEKLGPIDHRQLSPHIDSPEGSKAGDSFFNITINTTNGIDEVSLKDELKLFINETAARGTQNDDEGR